MTTTESNENPVFCLRLTPRDLENLTAIIDFDPDIPTRDEAGARTEGVRAALRDYAKKLRKRVGRAA